MHGAGEQDAAEVEDDEDQRGVGEDFVQVLPDATFALLLWTTAPYGRHVREAGLAALAVSFGMLAFWMGVIAAGLTSYYSWRVIFMTFHGKFRGEPEVLKKAHDSPAVMLIPLILLAVGAVFAGGLFKSDFVGEGALTFWGDSLPAGPYAEANYGETHGPDAGERAAEHGVELSPAETASLEAAASAEDHGEAAGEHGGHHPPTWVLFTPLAVTVAGFAIAWWFYILNAGLPARIAARGGPLHAFLYNKWYFDEIYDFVFVRGARALGDLFWKIGDKRLIDGLGPDGVARSAFAGAKRIAQVQSGYLYHYAFVMLIGLLALTLWLVAGAGVQ